MLSQYIRIRYAKKTNSSTGAVYYAYEYDYFIKDHQGNVRTVLTEGRDTATYAATMETKDSAVVQALFKNVYDPVRTVYAKPTAFDTDTSNHFVARLNASAGINIKTGPSLVLKVMAGDKVQASVYSYYTTPVQPPPGGVSLLADILAVLGQGVINNSGGHLAAGDLTGVNNALNPNVLSFLNTGRSYDNTKPKAYLNWILFDDQFNYVASNSGVQQVQPGTSAQVLSAPLQTISKNGYLYVYVSNESQQDVFFDKLTVKHYTGPLSQEQSFYPFGLQMAGISDKALLKPTNPYKFNGGSELEEDGGLNYYNTFYRKYDPQTGRFTGVDMQAEQFSGLNPYQFAANNPILFNDVTGAKYTHKLPTHGSGGVSSRSMIDDYMFIDPNMLYGDGGAGDGDGDGSGGGGGGFGNGPYANYYYDAWNNAPDGKDTHFTLDKNGNIVYYNYANYYGTATFETTGYHGLESDVPEGVYFFQGTSTHSYKTNDNQNGGNGWEASHAILDGVDLSWNLTKNGVTGAQRLANLASNTNNAVVKLGELKIAKFGKLVLKAEGAGHLLSFTGVAITIYDIGENGLNWSNGLDLVMGAAGFIPGVGWLISGTYFLANTIVKSETGESIGDHLGDALSGE